MHIQSPERPPALVPLDLEQIYGVPFGLRHLLELTSLRGLGPARHPRQVQLKSPDEVVCGERVVIPHLQRQLARVLVLGFVVGENRLGLVDDYLVLGREVTEVEDETPVEVPFAGYGVVVDVRALRVVRVVGPGFDVDVGFLLPDEEVVFLEENVLGVPDDHAQFVLLRQVGGDVHGGGHREVVGVEYVDPEL